MSTALFPLFYVTREVYRFLHRGRASRNRFQAQKWEKQKELANATMKWKGKGGFLTTIQIVLPAPPSPSGLCLFTATPVRGLRTTRHADKLTHTSVFSLPLWRLFVPHIVTDGMLAFTKE